MNKLLPYFFILLILSATALFFLFRPEPVKFNEVVAEGKFSISIPEYLSKTDSINLSAVLQYQNVQEQVFFMVFEGYDTLGLTLKDQFNLFADRFVSKMQEGNRMNYHPEKINGCEALIGDVRGRINETEVCYFLAIVRSGNRMYPIIAGVSAKQKSKYKEDLMKIIRGFKICS